MPLGDHAAHWANYLEELVGELPLHYPSWRQMPPKRKAGVVAKIEAALMKMYWVPKEDGTYDVERIKRGSPSHIFEVDWDAHIAFWNDPKNLARAIQNKQNREKSKVVCQQGSRDSNGVVTAFRGRAAVGEGRFGNYNAKAPIVSRFSSRGPNFMDIKRNPTDLLKPDILAPGRQIWSAWSPMSVKLKVKALD
nr:subtilisin-like protease SBT2.4 [Tanacetum cinerariifolium]